MARKKDGERAAKAVADGMLEGYLPDEDLGAVHRERERPKAGGRRRAAREAGTVVDDDVRAGVLARARWNVLDVLEHHGFLVKGSADSLAFCDGFAELVGKHFKQGGK